MECDVLKHNSDDGAAVSSRRAAGPPWFGGLDSVTARSVAVKRSRQREAPHIGRATAMSATDKDCRVEDFDLTALEIPETAKRTGWQTAIWPNANALEESRNMPRTYTQAQTA